MDPCLGLAKGVCTPILSPTPAPTFHLPSFAQASSPSHQPQPAPLIPSCLAPKEWGAAWRKLPRRTGPRGGGFQPSATESTGI